MKRSAWIAAIAAVAALLGWWALQGPESGESAVAAAPRAASPEAASRSPGADAPAELASASAAVDGELANRRATEATPTVDEDAAQRGDRRIEVVDALSGAPLAGVRVAYVELAEHDQAQGHPAWDLDTADAWLEQNAQWTTSDASGSAALPLRADRDAIVVGSHDGLYGRLVSKAGSDAERVERLELAPDATLRALVLDSSGSPLANVPVELRQRQNSWAREAAACATDEHGFAAFPHVQIEMLRGEGLWSVGVEGLLGEDAEAAVDAKALPRDPVELVLPAHGTVDVRVLNEDGSPFEREAQVELWIDDGSADDMPRFWSRPETLSQAAAKGLARFERVRLGQSLVAQATSNAAGESKRTRGFGPSTAGARIVLEVVIADQRATLRARLVDESGSPFAQRSITARYVQNSGLDWQDESRELKSDAKGYVEFPVRASDAPKADRSVTFTSPALDEPFARRAVVEFDRPLTPGIVDLGDVVLPTPPIAVAGRVIDGAGEPVAGARIRATGLDDEPRDSPYEKSFSCEGFSQENGEFALRCDTTSTTLRVEASQESLAASVRCATGERNLVVQLVERGRVGGRLLLDESVPAKALRVTFVASEQQDSATLGVHRAALGDGGGFMAVNLLPGLYTATVSVDSSGQSIATVERVQVPSGGTAKDSRLTIDLRGKLAALRLELEPPHPSDSVRGTVISTAHGAGPGEPATQFLSERVLELVAPGHSFDVTIDAVGFRRESLEGVSGLVRVELRRGPLVRLRIDPSIPLPEPPRYLKAFLAADGEHAYMFGHFQEESFGPHRDVVVRSPIIGAVKVRWLLEERSPNSLSTSSIDVAEPQVIEVLDRESEQLFELVVPQEELRARLERDDD